MALAMTENAERRGELKPGMTVVEYTGGSTGSSLAYICTVKGQRFLVVTSDVAAIAIAAGETKEITWSFTQAGEVLYGRHQPGHYDAGRLGAITVTG